MKREGYGWLVNPKRRERRERALTLTDSQVMELLNKIDELQRYTKLNPDQDRLIRIRDKALIALAWIFFKRGNEILKVKLGDVYYDDKELNVTFHISKKAKTFKVCPSCNEINAKRAVYCKKCGANLKTVELKKEKGETVVVKRKSLQYPFCRYVIEWVEEAKKNNCKPDDYLFAPFNFQAQSFLWGKKLTIQRFDQILQRLDPTLTSHMFRYGATEKFLRLGYTPYDLKEIGDWSTSIMPETYAKRKGLTLSQKKFAEDTRVI